MNTWSFRLAFFSAVFLGACSLTDVTWPLSGAERPEEAPRVDTSLPRAALAGGALNLSPPDGFCVDRRGLTQTFAVLARCDSLGRAGSGGGAPLGFITVSVAPGSAEIEQNDIARLTGLGVDMLARERLGRTTIVHLQGQPEVGADRRHWKALTRIGAHALLLSAYGPEGGALARTDGGEILATLITRTRAASEGQTRPQAVALEGTTSRGPGRIFGSLFD